MKNRTLLTMLALSLVAVSACADEGGGALTGGTNRTTAPPERDKGKEDQTQATSATAGSETSTFDHSNDPAGAAAPFEPVDPAAVRAVGSPEVTSRLHSCGKLSVASIGKFLESRGVTGRGARPPNTMGGNQIFNAGDSRAALGGANYDGRVPEAAFASTSAISKMYDIFSMASYDIVADNWDAPACPGTKILDGGKFTKDGVSCLLGKPATDEYVAIANDAIVKSPTDGAKIAIAAMLAAGHTCQ